MSTQYATAPIMGQVGTFPTIHRSSGGLTGASPNNISFVPVATFSTYLCLVVVNVTSWVTPASFTVTLKYLDDGPAGGTIQTETLAFARGSTGATAAAITAVDRWYAIPITFRAQPGQNINVSTTGTFTGTPVYNLDVTLVQFGVS